MRDDTALRHTALERAQVPDRYSSAHRVAGAYALLRWPFFAGVQAWERAHAARAAAPQVDAAQPVVFQRDAQALVGGQWLRQRIYTLWFAERPPSSTPDLLAGTLDGVIVRLNATGIGAAATEREAARYTLRDEQELRSLALPGGGRRSLYGPDGLVPGTERTERWLFWPMGIASAGAMRQWGHHATAFVGRRHFDDADLIERRFVIPALE